jgi:hypothetical protein
MLPVLFQSPASSTSIGLDSYRQYISLLLISSYPQNVKSHIQEVVELGGLYGIDTSKLFVAAGHPSLTLNLLTVSIQYTISAAVSSQSYLRLAIGSFRWSSR